MTTMLCKLGPTIVLTWLLAIPAAQAASSHAGESTETRIRHIVESVVGPTTVKGAKPQTLSERMRHMNVPGVSIAFFRNGKIEWTRGFGVTRTGGPPVTPETLFQAGSISKPVAAIAALRLVESGKLSLDGDVNQYLKTWKVPQNTFTQDSKVTLRGLLSHTAGLTVHGFAGYDKGQPVPTLTQVLNGERPANSPPVRVDIKPGTKFRYSGGGYTVMQQMLIDVTAKPFPILMRDLVLRPAAMSRSGYEQPLPPSKHTAAATPYDQFGHEIEGGAHTYPENAAAGLWSTPSDLARYAITVQNDLAGSPNPLLSQAMTREMLKPGKGNHGLGPAIRGKPARPYFAHDGVDAGFVSLLAAYNKGDGVVVMTNGDNGVWMIGPVARAVAREYGWPDYQPRERKVAKVEPVTLDRLTGAYRLSRFSVLRITRDGNQLYARLTGQPQTPLYPQSARKWFRIDVDTDLTFDGAGDANAGQVTWAQDGPGIAAKRITDVQARQIEDNLAIKVKRQRADPAVEATLRRTIDALQRAKPNYAEMTPTLLPMMREHSGTLQSFIRSLGALRQITFKRAEPNGDEIYRAVFEKGNMVWTIGLDQDGKITTVWGN